ncbi:MAG: nucleoside-diphosphate kinase [Candidatus Micrarchaeota archaeon]|nr:nucleoside-diphosphate kinase [Candidatus Micrarchaeota archaeon]
MQKTLILIKPDAMERKLAGQIITRFEQKGLDIVAIKMLTMTKELAQKHYAQHLNKPFYKGLEEFMCSRPIIAMVVQGVEAIEVVRNLVGATNARKALPGTIRGDLANSLSSNVVHASDSAEAAEKEIKLFFKEEEIFDKHKPILQDLMYAKDEL